MLEMSQSCYAFETRCFDCNVLCLHFEPRLVICPECETILRFECGLESIELVELAEKLHSSGKSARWGLKQLGYDTEEYDFKSIVDDLAMCGLIKCQHCNIWEWQTEVHKDKGCKICQTGEFYD